MIAKDLINYMIPPLKPTDNVGKALQWMEELRTSEIPVVDDGRFLGVLNEELIFEKNSHTNYISDYALTGSSSFIAAESHYYEVLKLSYRENVSLVAVLDEKEQYLGVVAVTDIIDAFAQSASISSPGAIVVIAMAYNDYSLAEISRLVESNDCKILSSYVSSDRIDPNRIRLTLKLNIEDASRVVATLERFGYSLESQFSEKELSDTSEKDRFDSFMKYLHI